MIFKDMIDGYIRAQGVLELSDVDLHDLIGLDGPQRQIFGSFLLDMGVEIIPMRVYYEGT